MQDTNIPDKLAYLKLRKLWSSPIICSHDTLSFLFQVILQQTKHFTCECPRCLDPSELGTNLAAMRCSKCKTGDVLPLKPTNLKTDFECHDCREVIEAGMVSLLREVNSTCSSVKMK